MGAGIRGSRGAGACSAAEVVGSEQQPLAGRAAGGRRRRRVALRRPSPYACSGGAALDAVGRRAVRTCSEAARAG